MGDRRKHAVVTGTSSGIGRATAVLLTEHKFHVFATVRNENDGRSLAEEGGGLITPLVMDVTVPEQVAEAADTVRRHVGDAGLDVLVNNAGQGHFHPIEFLPRDKFRQHLAVNTEGALAVAQALIPALRARRGRIVFIGSIAGWFTMPFSGPHAATKHALRAVADAMRQELAPWDIGVTVVEPGSVRTAAMDKMAAEHDEVLAEIGAEGRALYGAAFERMMTAGLAEGRKGSPPEVIARVVLRAVNARRLRHRYLAGRSARPLAALATLPTGLLDAVQRRLFSLPRPGSMAGPPSGATPPTPREDCVSSERRR